MSPGPLRHGIAEPVGRREPDEREDGDHPDVVGQRGAFVGPEERAIEGAGERRPVDGIGSCSARGTCSRCGWRPPGSTARGSPTARAAIRFVNAPIMNSTMRSGRSMNPTLHFVDERLGPRAGVARHDREDQRQRRDHHVIAAAELGIQEDQTGQQREIREAIERRVPERAELATAAAAGAPPCRR